MKNMFLGLRLFSTLERYQRVPYLHLHPPLPASKAVFIWSRLLVVCALNTAGVADITGCHQLVPRN